MALLDSFITVLQTRVYAPSELECVLDIDVDDTHCLEQCEGMIVNVQKTKGRSHKKQGQMPI